MNRVGGNVTDLCWVIDEAIPLTPALTPLLGNVRLLPGRDIGPAVVENADVLLVRSVTQVDETLLAGSAVRFVGTATAGVDHLDVAALARLDIPWASAPGSNATAVVEYVLSAIAMSGYFEVNLVRRPGWDCRSGCSRWAGGTASAQPRMSGSGLRPPGDALAHWCVEG